MRASRSVPEVLSSTVIVRLSPSCPFSAVTQEASGAALHAAGADDGDRQGLVVLALEGTCHLTEVDVMELFLVFGTSCQCRGSQKGGEAFVQIVFVHGWMVC